MPSTVRSQRKVGGSAKLTIPLPHNSAVVMWGDCQESWHHSVPRCAGRSIAPHRRSGLVRFSLTYRMSRASEMPSLGRCRCAVPRPLSLKCQDGRYVVFCHANSGSCRFVRKCEWATEDALRLKRLDEGARDGAAGRRDGLADGGLSVNSTGAPVR